MQYYEKLSADTLYLSPVNPDDYELFCSWNNNRTIAERIGMLTTMQNNGYGTKVGQLLFDFCFKVLNLNSVYARAASFKEPSLRLCKKLGFVEVGRRRQAWYNDGKYHGEVLVDILRSEYESRL